MKKNFAALLFWPLLLCMIPAGAAARVKAKPPQMLVLVFAMPSGLDRLGFTYPGVVPHAQAQHDLSVLQSETHWSISDVKITDDKPPVPGYSAKMTSVEFTASNAVLNKDHRLQVEPFVQTFRSYKNVSLTYIVSDSFQFQGLRRYSDNHVQIFLDQHGSAYTYHIQIIDANFQRLNLPLSQPADSEIRWVGNTDHENRIPHKVASWLMALVALAAAGIGCLVYAAMTRSA